VARHYVIKGYLFILHHAGLRRHLTPSVGCNAKEYQPEIPLESPNYLPSWIPDFNRPKSFEHIPWFDNNFSAGLRMSLARVTIDPHIAYRIHVVGKIIDIVERRICLPGMANSQTCSNPSATWLNATVLRI
jgi:hypothetical protein